MENGRSWRLPNYFYEFQGAVSWAHSIPLATSGPVMARHSPLEQLSALRFGMSAANYEGEDCSPHFNSPG